MKNARFIAVDLGAESGRVIGAEVSGEHIRLQEIHRFANRPLHLPGGIFWNVPGLFEEIKTGLSRAAALSKDWISLGIDTWGVDFGLISPGGELLGLPHVYRDPRTDGIAERVLDIIPREKLYRHTGNQIMQINSLFQLYAQSREPAGPQLLKLAAHLLFMPDLFNYLLTGVAANEYTIASTSQMLDAESRQWAVELLADLGLPGHFLGKPVQPGTRLGPLLPEIKEESGLDDLSVVAVAGHDTACAVAAVPESSPARAYLSSGTWSLLGIETDRPIISQQSMALNFTNEGGVDHKIRFLKNCTGLWLLQQVRAKWASAGEVLDYGELVELAASAKPFHCLIDVDDPSFLHPPDMTQAISAYCRKTGQQAPRNRAQFVRTILESLALKYREIIEAINDLQPVPVDALHIVGGGSKNRLLNQFAANATGLPVHAGPVEATALGNIIIQALAAGLLQSIGEGRQLVAGSTMQETFLPRDRDAWDQKFAEFKSITGRC